jgi:hypothetical protein
MSILFQDGKIIRSAETEDGKGAIEEMDDEGNVIDTLAEYPDWETAEEVLWSMAYKEAQGGLDS